MKLFSKNVLQTATFYYIDIIKLMPTTENNMATANERYGALIRDIGWSWDGESWGKDVDEDHVRKQMAKISEAAK